jgi:hypothetical protein
VCHFALLGQATGVAAGALAGLRNGAGAFLPRRQMILVSWGCVLALGAVSVTYPGVGIAVLGAFVLRAIANHLRDNAIGFYALSLTCELLWAAYGIAVGSTMWSFSATSAAIILVHPLRRAFIERRNKKADQARAVMSL